MSEISDEEILIFARVPKTGSLGINHLLMHLRDIHNFTTYSSIEGMPTKDGDTEYLYETDKHFRYVPIGIHFHLEKIDNAIFCNQLHIVLKFSFVGTNSSRPYLKQHQNLRFMRDTKTFSISRNFIPIFRTHCILASSATPWTVKFPGTITEETMLGTYYLWWIK